MEYAIVALFGFVLGGWAVPLGFLLGLGPVATFVSAAGGALVGCWTFLLAGDRIADWARRHRRAESNDVSAAGDVGGKPSSEAGAGRVRRFVDRHGVQGLGVVGPIFPGVTASVVGGLALGLDRRLLGRWLTVGIIVMYGLYVLGVSLLVALLS